jgi:hypothetical protein
VRPVFYLAHPVGEDPGGKLRRTERWLLALEKEVPDAVFVAPWFGHVSAYLGTSFTTHEYDEFLTKDLEVVRRTDGVLLVGGASVGGRRELETSSGLRMDWSDRIYPDDVEPVRWNALRDAAQVYAAKLAAKTSRAPTTFTRDRYTVVTRPRKDTK